MTFRIQYLYYYYCVTKELNFHHNSATVELVVTGWKSWYVVKELKINRILPMHLYLLNEHQILSCPTKVNVLYNLYKTKWIKEEIVQWNIL